MTLKTDWITQELNRLKEAGLYNRIRTISSPQGARLIVDGKQVLNFCSNNYLGLANHPRLVAAAEQALEGYGAGTGGSAVHCWHHGSSFGIGKKACGIQGG